MSQLLSNERKYILASFASGFSIIAMAVLFAIFVRSDASLWISGSIVLSVYFGLPSVFATKRSLKLVGNKYFNSDEEDITNRIPKNFIWRLAIFMILCGFFFTNRLVNDLFLPEKLSIFLDGIITIGAPWVIIHTYFFIKDLPVATYFIFTNSGGGISYNNSSNRSVKYSSSSNDYITSRAYSNLGCNINHQR